MIERKLETTLRLHQSPVTCVEIFYLPSSLTFHYEDSEYPVLSPTLISSDQSGLIIWWNLTTRRPLGIWKAHDASILSISQLGILWKEGDGASLPVLNTDYGRFLTHSRDGTVKIWSLIDLLQESENLLENLKSGFVYSKVLKKKIAEDFVDPPLLYTLPVNSLNFSNIDYNSSNYLLTPATTDSECFDVYALNLKEKDEFKRLKRLIAKYKPKEENNSNNKIEELDFSLDTDIGDDPDLTKRGGTGVIMKLKWLNRDTFFVGYENGKIYGFTMDESLELKIVYENDFLLGNPITSIHIDEGNDRLLFSSTGSKVCVLNLQNYEETKLFDVKHKGISDISSDSISKTIGLVTWDGFSRFYEYDETKVLKFNFKIRRQLASIANSQELSNATDENNNLQNVRSNILKFTKSQFNSNSDKDKVKVNYNNGMSKNIVRRNREKVFDGRWLFIGYQDGKIAMYSVE